MPVFLLFLVITVPIVLSEDEVGSWVGVLIAVGMVAVLGLVVLFSRLQVTVSGGVVTASFGFGWPSRTIDLSDVTSVRQVRNTWWYGWGIRKVPGGWMYNVWGLDAVELELSSGKVFRVGSDEPEVLLGVLTIQLKP